MEKVKKQKLPTDEIRKLKTDCLSGKLKTDCLSGKFNTDRITKKFNVIIDKNNNPVIWIDDIVHFFTQSQYDAFIKQALYIAHKMNPEIDYSKYLK